MVNAFQHEHRLWAGIAVGARLAALACLFVIEPGLYNFFIKPESDASTI